MQLIALVSAFFAAGIITGLAFARAASVLEGAHDVFDDDLVTFEAEPTAFSRRSGQFRGRGCRPVGQLLGFTLMAYTAA